MGGHWAGLNHDLVQILVVGMIVAQHRNNPLEKKAFMIDWKQKIIIGEIWS